VAVPLFIGSAGRTRFTVNAPVAPGMPIYTPAGELFAIAGQPASREAFPVRDASERLRRQADTTGPSASIGVTLQDVSGELARVFAGPGAVVTAVVPGAPADQAGINAGDVVLALGDTTVTSAETAAAALAAARPNQPIVLRLRRMSRTTTTTVTPVTAYRVAALARSAPEPEALVTAGAILPGAALGAHGIPHGAQLVAINGRPVPTLDAATRELRRVRPRAALLLRHDGRHFYAAIETPR
jgi:membrane-associated protease RseP (regulator of RpoE activity)